MASSWIPAWIFVRIQCSAWRATLWAGIDSFYLLVVDALLSKIGLVSPWLNRMVQISIKKKKWKIKPRWSGTAQERMLQWKIYCNKLIEFAMYIICDAWELHRIVSYVGWTHMTYPRTFHTNVTGYWIKTEIFRHFILCTEYQEILPSLWHDMENLRSFQNTV